MLDVPAWRSRFPVTKELAYLAFNRRGPASLAVRDVVAEALGEQVERGVLAAPRWFDEYERTRGVVAALIGAAPEEVAFTKNVTDAVALLAGGFPWREGDNMITADAEYPANRYPWLAAARRNGVEARVARAAGPGGRLPFESVTALADERTRLLAISFVEYQSGLRNDLARYGRWCAARDIFLAVDGVQGIGCLAFDMRALGAHFVAGDGRKWLCAIDGAGFFALHRDWMERIDLVYLGAGSMAAKEGAEPGANPAAGERSANRPAGGAAVDGLTLRADSRRFEGGARATLPILALGAAARLALEVGAEPVEERVQGLVDALHARLAAAGARVLSPLERRERSGIVVFDAGAGLPEAGAARCRALFGGLAEARGVVVTARGGPVTAAVHFFNDERDLDRLAEVVHAARSAAG